MDDTTVLRVGGWAALAGGVLAVLVNLFAPRASSDALGDPAAQIELATTNSSWEVIQVGVLVAILVLLAAFYAITKSIDDEPAGLWARLGLGAVLLASTVGAGAFVINARLSDAAEGLGSDVLVGAVFISGALFIAWEITYFGLGALLYGIAIATTKRYPAWLGWATIIGGAVGLASGFINAFAGATAATTYILFPISSGILTLVILYLGVLLMRQTSTQSN